MASRWWIISCFLVSGPAAAGGPTTIAVMPFRDLSASHDAVGEAISETVTADLKEVGLRVIDRAHVEQVLLEQHYAVDKAELDLSSTRRVGTLLGATMLVAGAFQKSGTQLRLTARFINVETAEIVGTAKVDGTASDFLTLQDQITAQLLKSAGIEAKRIHAFASRPRSKVNYKTVKLYGDALREPEDRKRQTLLKLTLTEDPHFVYAVRDLADLEKRLELYGGISTKALAQREREQLGRIRSASVSNAEKLNMERDLVEALIGSRRFNTLANLAPTFDNNSLGTEGEELGLYGLFIARRGQHLFDKALQTGERFLKQFPLSRHFREVDSAMRDMIESKRRQEARRQEYAADVQEQRQGLAGDGGMPPEHQLRYDYAPCIAARWDGQVNNLMLTSCSNFLEKHRSDTGELARTYRLGAQFFVILALAQKGEFGQARPLIEKLRGETQEWDDELHKLMADWPTD
jgi:TolB-like protein